MTIKGFQGHRLDELPQAECKPDRNESSVAIRVSVVIPTLNRESTLLNTVHALLDAPSPYFLELIVVDQSNQPSRLVGCKDERLRYIHVMFKNVSKARNYGASLARGNVVLFLDDDVARVAHIVEAHAVAHIRTNACCVTGPILTENDTLVSIDSLHSLQRAKLTSGELFISNLDAQYIPLFAPSGNASYKKEMLFAIGGFDENFIGSTFVGEDAEISHRVKADGGMIIYEPTASIVHLHVSDGGCRDEAYELKSDETSVFNAHYFVHRIGRPRLMTKLFLRILRKQVINRKTLKGLTILVLARRTCGLISAWRRARVRTRELMRVGSANWLADKASKGSNRHGPA